MHITEIFDSTDLDYLEAFKTDRSRFSDYVDKHKQEVFDGGFLWYAWKYWESHGGKLNQMTFKQDGKRT